MFNFKIIWPRYYKITVKESPVTGAPFYLLYRASNFLNLLAGFWLFVHGYATLEQAQSAIDIEDRDYLRSKKIDRQERTLIKTKRI